MTQGRFKALLILSPGPNALSIEHAPTRETPGTEKRGHTGDDGEFKITLNYVPLLQTPPLYLAILVAKDSPLLIDCPPFKRGGLSSAHSDLEAAIKKFRMTAYMWQALTAEDFRSKGLGRRAFRLEEEWTTDTLSSTFVNSSFHANSGAEVGLKSSVRSTAKIHVIRFEKTVAELRNAQIAQQNKHAGEHQKQDLHKWFTDALKAAGGPFIASAKPIVAGLILDSHYDPECDLILAHAAFGNSNPKGVSLGMFGSHLTYSWPRFVEEVASCLMDTSSPGETVGNDEGECGTAWEACATGQGAFLREVGHAFGAGQTENLTGEMGPGRLYPVGNIMQRGYAHHWPKNFLSHTAYCSANGTDGFCVEDGDGDGKMVNPARWDLKDALAFRIQPHFWVPGDAYFDAAFRSAMPEVRLVEGGASLIIESSALLARISSPWGDLSSTSVQLPIHSYETDFNLLQYQNAENYDTMVIRALGMNGREKSVNLKPVVQKPSKSIDDLQDSPAARKCLQ